MNETDLIKAVHQLDDKTVCKAMDYHRNAHKQKTVKAVLAVSAATLAVFITLAVLAYTDIITVPFILPGKTEQSTESSTAVPGHFAGETVTVLNDIAPVTLPANPNGDIENTGLDTVYAPIPDAVNCTVRRLTQKNAQKLLDTLYPKGVSDIITLSRSDAELYMGGDPAVFKQFDGGLSKPLAYGFTGNEYELTFYAVQSETALDCMMFFIWFDQLCCIRYRVTDEQANRVISVGSEFFEAFR